MNPNNKGNRKRKQKNFDGESGTTPETNALGADKRKNHRKGLQKRKKTTRKKEVKFSSDMAPAQPYARNNKNKIPTPAESGGTHRFNKGGKKNHQQYSHSLKTGTIEIAIAEEVEIRGVHNIFTLNGRLYSLSQNKHH